MSSRVAVCYAGVLFFALSIAACRTHPVNEPQIHLAGTVGADRMLTEAQIADAIKRAGAEAGWTMADAGPGHITGTLRVRDKHVAVADISYSKTQIKIAYKDSENLLYDDGKIHRNYNKWVEQLAAAIRKQLASVS